MDPRPVTELAELIEEAKNGKIRMPIGSSIPEVVQVEVTQQGGRCTIKLTYKEKSYSFDYPLEENSTMKTAQRVNSDRTLEKDLLLARSFFVRELY